MVTLPVAAVGMLNSMLTGAIMAFSSLFEVSNSLRLGASAPASPGTAGLT